MIKIIVAVSKNGFIGKNGQIPWHLQSDMEHFVNTTTGHTVIMGRKTWESIPAKFRPLSNRRNIVVTHQENYEALGAEVTPSLHLALAKHTSQDAFIIGGGQLYEQGMKQDLVDMLIITKVDIVVNDGTVSFPEIDSGKWELVQEIKGERGKKDEYEFVFEYYRRTR